MGMDPHIADTIWIAGLVMLGLFILFKFVNRKNYTEGRFERRVGGERPDPDRMEDPGPMLRRVRVQIILSIIGLGVAAYIAFMGIGEKPVGIPLPEGLFDAFR